MGLDDVLASIPRRPQAGRIPAHLRRRLTLPRVRVAPAQLGAIADEKGTNFSVYSENATAATLVTVDSDGTNREYTMQRHGNVWSGYVEGTGAGTRYGYRMTGPQNSQTGARFDPKKLLLDPLSRAVDESGKLGYPLLSVVVPPADPAPARVVEDDERDLVYEAHVKGQSKLDDAVPEKLRGTYLGLAHPAVTKHMRRLGVKVISVMPVWKFLNHPGLAEQGLANYWGYDPVVWQAPENRYGVSQDPLEIVKEFRTMTRELHSQGLKVRLDVVLNHTAEGPQDRPAISFRGIDNQAFYRLLRNDPNRGELNAADPNGYVDITGCGNTVDFSHPAVIRMAIESLRYWVTEMGVDSFRFDEAPVVGRDAARNFNPQHPFFNALQCDPVLAGRIECVAEPWDATPSTPDPGRNAYKQGEFPDPWAEWNGRFRDDVRDFWIGRASGVAGLTTRVAGSSDLFQGNHRGPKQSVNYLACHDGFTLRDVVSYNEKHNEANLENNRDGTNDNHSWNHGVEGETLDPAINALRSRQQRNMLATLFLSQGTPQLLAGDEVSRTQHGNNNPYNQDNAKFGWIDWAGGDQELLDFTVRLSEFRQQHPALRRDAFFTGRDGGGARGFDVLWLKADGNEMPQWGFTDGNNRSLGMWLAGDRAPSPDDDLLVMFHGGDADLNWQLPANAGCDWSVEIDSAVPGENAGTRAVADGAALTVKGKSVVVLRAVNRS